MVRLRGTGSVFKKKDSRYLYISYYDSNGVQQQESTKSELRQVAEGILRDRLSKVEQGLPVEQLKKLRYKDLRAALITDYKIKENKTFDEDGKFVVLPILMIFSATGSSGASRQTHGKSSCRRGSRMVQRTPPSTVHVPYSSECSTSQSEKASCLIYRTSCD
jgi:hypothetical protein